jgi:DNA-binding Lrp family transcriptional regulator
MGFEHKNDNDKNKKSPVRLDSINIRIISELVKNANAKSPEIAKKTKIPLSTVQRTKARLEESIKKGMMLILQNLVVELLIS